MAHILIVDDEPSIRISLREFALREGHRVDVAADVDEAVVVLDAAAPDVVVTDVILPRHGGLELLRLIRDKAPGTRVILITGEPTVEAATEALRQGATDFLSKPILRDDFVAALRRATSRVVE